jgi:hypothetical protein
MKEGLQGQWAPRRQYSSSLSVRRDIQHEDTRAKVHGRLECCLLHMFIGRPFILAHRQTRPSRKCGHTDAGGHIVDPTSLAAYGQWDFLIQDAILAAEEVISICQDLRSCGMGLARSSYAEYSSCRASLLVLIAHSVCCRTNEHSGTLRKGLDAIREMASVGESAQSEVSLLETLEDALHRIHSFDNEESTTTIEIDRSQNGYEGLFNWYTSMADPGKTRPNAREYDVRDSRISRLSNPASAQFGADRPCPPNTDIPAAQVLDEYPFDLDLLNVDGSSAFFAPNFTGFGDTDTGLFENLPWPPG